jgi:hypothetical protein
MRIDLHPRLRRRARKLSAADRDQIAEALRALADGFGSPHLHSGLGIRRLRKDLFECRAGLQWRTGQVFVTIALRETISCKSIGGEHASLPVAMRRAAGYSITTPRLQAKEARLRPSAGAGVSVPSPTRSAGDVHDALHRLSLPLRSCAP